MRVSLIPKSSWVLIGCFLFASSLPFRKGILGISCAVSSTQNISDLLDSLLEGYDYHLRPGVGGSATQVFIDIEVRSMGPVSEVDMTYSMDCYFRQSWVDKRLAYRSTMPALALSISMLERIWRPDTYFYNGKHSYLHTITTPNKFVRLYKDGRVLYSSRSIAKESGNTSALPDSLSYYAGKKTRRNKASKVAVQIIRLTIRASCPMKLENFPMDVQRCPLEIGSFGYSVRDVQYKWNPARSVVIASDMKLSMFDVTDTPTGNLTEVLQKGAFSVLMVSFHLKRHMGYFIIEVYAPCTMLVVLSWVAFWINREATADRVALGVTTVLTMTFLGLESRNNLPKVPYCTALDYFVAISFGFIFATIIQFAIVHYYTKVGSGEYYFPPTTTDLTSSEEDDDSRDNKPDVTIGSNAQNKIAIYCTEDAITSTNSKTTPTPLPVSTTHQATTSQDSCSVGMQSDLRRSRMSHNGRLSGSSRNKRKSYSRSSRGSLPHFQLNSVSRVDKVSRVIFPLTFIFINFMYWHTYLMRTN